MLRRYLRYEARLVRRAWSDTSRVGVTKAAGALIALLVSAALQYRAGAQTLLAGARAVGIGAATYVVLAGLELLWHYLRGPALLDLEREQQIDRLRAELAALQPVRPSPRELQYRSNRLREWAKAYRDANRDLPAMWITQLLPTGERLEDYVEVVEAWAREKGVKIVRREPTLRGVHDIKFKLPKGAF